MKSYKSIILVLTAATLWGTAGIFVRSLKNLNIESMQTVFGRAFFSIIIYALIILFTDTSLFRIRLKDLWAFIFLGLFSIVMFNYCYYKTMSLSSLSTAAVLLYTAPFFVIILSALIWKEKITLKKSFAFIVAFLGCCFVCGAFDESVKITSECLFFGLLTGLGYGLYTIFGNILIKRGYKTLTINFYAFLFAALCSLPLSSPVITVKTIYSAPKIILILLLMSILNTILPYICYTAALRRLDGSTALIIATFEPVVASVLGFFVFGELLTLGNIAGIILVLSSVIILNIQRGGKNEDKMQR